jgi:carboxymethylenebutenolidase
MDEKGDSMNTFQHYLAEEFAEDFQEGRIPRREAIKLIASVTGSFVLAETFLAACAPPPSGSTQATAPTLTAALPTASSTAAPSAAVSTDPAGTVSPEDPDVRTEDVEFAALDAQISGYLARPSSAGASPVILVCHENRGLTDHIRDVARRLAKAGYLGLAVDLLSRQGGSQAVGQDNVPGVLGNQSPDQFASDFRAGWEYLATRPEADPARVGMVGFCFGGGVTWLVATRMPELLAAVPFYGPHPAVADVPNIRAAVLAIYAGRDDRINQGISAIEAAMRENGKVYEKVIYPDVDHAFHNDTGTRYAPEAARDAWARTLAWFDRYVRSD